MIKVDILDKNNHVGVLKNKIGEWVVTNPRYIILPVHEKVVIRLGLSLKASDGLFIYPYLDFDYMLSKNFYLIGHNLNSDCNQESAIIIKPIDIEEEKSGIAKIFGRMKLTEIKQGDVLFKFRLLKCEN